MQPEKKKTVTIREDQRRRADNQIWNAAGAYDFQPSVRAYDEAGRARLYWNSIIGAAEKHFGRELSPLWEAVHAAEAENICEQLAWLGVESACFARECLHRPAFPLLRAASADDIGDTGLGLPEPYASVCRLYFQRAAGVPDGECGPVPAEAAALLDRLEFSAEITGPELAGQILQLLDERTLLIPRVKPFESSGHRLHLPFRRKKAETDELSPVRGLSGGIGEHTDPFAEHYVYTGKHVIWDMNEQQSTAAIDRYVRDIFGTPLLSDAEAGQLERTLCCGSHEGCHLWFARGDGLLSPNLQGYASVVRRRAVRQMAKNRRYYETHADKTRTAIARLTEKWRNAFLTARADCSVRSDCGRLQANCVWRSERVGDSRLFRRILPADNGDFTVDILLDGSLSQEERQSRVALQAYIAAESLTRCGIPVRVCSFSSVSGYTILTQYRGYRDTQDNRCIFNYTTFGGNRDGLAVRLMGQLMETGTEPAEHRILLLLSDVRPNDSVYIRSGGGAEPYHSGIAVQNTAEEIRLLRNRGVSVLCIYTGTDDDLPSARKIYNRDFVRIRSLDHFAHAVGNLVLTQILQG